MLINILILSLSFFDIKNEDFIYNPVASDTMIVAQLIEKDSIFEASNFLRTGIKYFYGVHHLKVGRIDVQNNKITDTLILAYVYNMLTDTLVYKRNFGLKTGEKYIFFISPFKPCQSDFPKIQGTCFEGSDLFYPESNTLIKQYTSINRILYSAKFDK